MHAHTVALEPLDLGRGDIDELVGKIGERAGRCELLADMRSIGILGRAPGTSPPAELSIVDTQQRLRLRDVGALIDDQLDGPDLAVAVHLHSDLPSVA